MSLSLRERAESARRRWNALNCQAAELIRLASGLPTGKMLARDGETMMENPRRQAALTAAAMVLIAIFVLFVLPPAANDSEQAFRLVVACAAIVAGVLKWRRALRDRHDGGQP